jgi:DNA/RNA-binding domain of Phe-tRNA-synthetase-like protein
MRRIIIWHTLLMIEKAAAVTQPLFIYSPDILPAFPTLSGGMIAARGLPRLSDASYARITEKFQSEQQAVTARIGDTPLSEIASLSAWRGAFRKFGVDPTQYRSAAESLLRRLTKKGDIPSINPLVDIGNMISIRHALPVAMIDLDGIRPPLYARFAVGDERFHDLGDGADETPGPGEVIFAQADGTVHARRWCWRQSVASAAGPETTHLLVTIEAQHAGGDADVRAALGEVQALLAEAYGVSSHSAVIGPNAGDTFAG